MPFDQARLTSNGLVEGISRRFQVSSPRLGRDAGAYLARRSDLSPHRKVHSIIWSKHARDRAVRKGIATVYPKLWRYCVALTGSREKADDLAQAACLRAMEKTDLYDPKIKFDPWMFRLTQRLWLNEMRSNTIRTGTGLINIEDAGLMAPEPDPELSAQGQDVWRTVMKLPEAQRSTVFLVYVEGHSYREAAEIIDVPVGTIMSRLAAARKKLAEIFANEEENQQWPTESIATKN